MKTSFFLFLAIFGCDASSDDNFELNQLVTMCDRTMVEHFKWLFNHSSITSKKCVQIVYADESLKNECVLNGLLASELSYIIRDLSDLFNQDIFDYDFDVEMNENSYEMISNYKLCNSYVVFSNNYETILNVFTISGTTNQSVSQRFYPFSNIFLVTFNYPSLCWKHLDYVNKQAIYVYWLESRVTNQISSINSIRNCVTNSTIYLVGSEKSSELSNVNDVHPLLKDKGSLFRVSFFECHPYVHYLYDENNGVKYDGLEYRFVIELTKNWNRSLIARQFKEDTWDIATNDLRDGVCDLAMCSIWLSIHRYRQFDLTGYFDFQCGTMLVPKPPVIHAASNIYLSLSETVWIAVGISFLLTGVVLTCFSKFGCTVCATDSGEPNQKDFIFEKKSIYNEVSRAFLDILGVITGHGVEHIPNQKSIQWILTSWMITSLLLGVVYATGYTSLLARPRFLKPVDTLEEFLTQGLSWGYINLSDDLISDLKFGITANFRKFFQQGFQEQNIQERIFNIKYKEGYSRLVKTLLSGFVTEIDDIMNESATYLRLMKSCFYNHYTVFLLKKHSPYTNYVSDQIKRFQESGILKHWMDEIPIEHKELMRSFFQEDGNHNRNLHGRSLTVHNVSGAFSLLIVGLICSSTAFIFEYFDILMELKQLLK